MSCHALLQVIFPTQGLNPGLPHCRKILYQLSYQGSPLLCCLRFYNINVFPSFFSYLKRRNSQKWRHLFWVMSCSPRIEKYSGPGLRIPSLWMGTRKQFLWKPLPSPTFSPSHFQRGSPVSTHAYSLRIATA